MQYPKRLQKFLDFLEIEGSTIDEKCLKCYNLIKRKTKRLKIEYSNFIIFQNKRIDNKEIGPGGFQLTVVPNNPFIGSPDFPLNVEEPTTTDGRVLFTSENGSTSYSFGAVIDIEDNVTRHLGAAFFDANVTGNLEFLKSIVGVYKAVIGEKGIFAMWQLK